LIGVEANDRFLSQSRMLDFFRGLFDSSFMPHGHCYRWQADLVWLHVVSDGLITLAYYAIPFALIYFVARRRDLAFPWIFVLFGAFIILCGTTHLLEVWSVWHGTYWLTGSVKLLTGLVSISTAVALVPLIPKALVLPSPSHLAAVNRQLQQEVAERRQAEAALRASEQRFRAIFDSMFQFAGLMKPDGTLVEANQTVLDFGGLRLEDCIDRPFRECHWWAHAPEAQAGLQDATRRAARGEFVRYKAEMRGVGDRMATVDFSIKPVYDEHGAVEMLLFEGRDVTEWRKAEEALQEERVFRTIFESAPLGIVLADRDGRVVQANRAISKMLGQPLQALQAAAVTSFVHPGDRAETERQMQRVRAGEIEGFELEKRYLRSDGAVLWAHVAVQVVRDGRGHVTGTLAQVADVTDRRKAEEALRESEERFRSTFEQAPVGVTHVSPAGRFLRVNQRFCTLVGYSREALLEKTIVDVTYPDDQAVDREQVRRALAGEITSYTREKRYVRSDGALIWIDLTVSLVRDEHGAPKYFIGVVEDISERKQAEAALRESKERYQTLFDSIDEGFCVIEMIFGEDEEVVDYRFLETNPAFEEQTGLVDAVGRTARELVPNLERDWVDIYGTVATTGKATRFVQESEAMERWFDVYAFRIGEPAERKVALLFNNITGHKQIENALRESEARLQAIIDNAGAIVFTKDLEGRYRLVNRQFEEIFARTRDDRRQADPERPPGG
jgi:PAS domain S-box-containing protein